MRFLFGTAALVLLASCGSPPGSPTDMVAKAKAREAELVQGPTHPGQLSLATDGSGCQDRAEATRLVAASKKEDKTEYLKLWADGMKDQRCRGFAEGLGVTVTKTDAEGWPCIIPADDPNNKTCFWIERGLTH